MVVGAKKRREQIGSGARIRKAALARRALQPRLRTASRFVRASVTLLEMGGTLRWTSPEGVCVLVLALLGALRVLAFAGGFPFFSNVDEHRHVDAALKYSRGYWPAPGTDAYESEMPTWLGMYGSPEYHLRSGEPTLPPPWKGSAARTVEMTNIGHSASSSAPASRRSNRLRSSGSAKVNSSSN